ncbi:nitrogenase component 1 [uncultured Clostridium sp.]|uniref:nitrogenase component 1 n=1 Tax=uncultured Clostridium sp. TaxID=59620 RepID=UPI0025E78DF6|nr:nitrogenase component 1 [uncultured Clostridium sp.]
MNKNVCKANSTLHYCSPAHGGWGIVRVGMLVPESYQLFVCPFACGRHGALGAFQQGTKKRLSYLFIDEADIISGSYEELIHEAVGELLSALKEKPKVIFIGVSCLDDLLGTDHKALLSRLKADYPIDFQVLHMNPISSDSKNPPGINIQRKIYELVKTSENRDNELNLIGNYVMLEENNELLEILREMGINKVKHISNYSRYEDFQDMGNSRYNLVLRPEARRAAEDMKINNKIEYCFVPISYQISQIKKEYEIIKNMIAPDKKIDLKKYEEGAISMIAKARECIKDIPISIDNSSVCRPYSLARALIEYGFNVESIYEEGLPEFEKDSYEWLIKNSPQVKIYPSENPVMILRNDSGNDEKIAIGYNAGYMTKAKYVVDLVFDEKMFGFSGICLLMDKLIEAYTHPTDLKKLITGYGLVV